MSGRQEARLAELEQRLGYVFKDRALLREAMTHGSAYSLAVMTDSASHKGLAAGAAIVGFPWLYAILRYAPTTVHVPSLKAAAEAAALANTNPLLALLILIADQKAKIKRADLVERVKFSAADLEIMRKW